MTVYSQWFLISLGGCCCISSPVLSGQWASEGSLRSTTATTTLQSKYYNKLVESLPSQRGKCVAITGTTSGLGHWAAVAAARKGPACLIMLNRQSSRAVHTQEDIKRQAPVGTAIITVTCDLENMTSVRLAAATVNRIVEPYGGLDILALNAGIMQQPDVRTSDGFDVTMQTNHLSHFLLVKLLMPSLRAASNARHEVRVVTHSSVARGTCTPHGRCFTEGGGPVNEKFFLKSTAGSLGGNEKIALRERYHQSKLANIVFAMAMHFKLRAAGKEYAGFKALSAAPGFSDTNLHIPPLLNHTWVKDLIALSAPDGSCSLLTSMFASSAESGDFYEPSLLINGPPLKVISGGVALPPHFLRWAAGIQDDDVCAAETREKVWKASEDALREKFTIRKGSVLVV